MSWTKSGLVVIGLVVMALIEIGLVEISSLHSLRKASRLLINDSLILRQIVKNDTAIPQFISVEM